MRIEQALTDLGLKLPEPMRMPPGVELNFPWVRVTDNRAYVLSSTFGVLRPVVAGRLGVLHRWMPLSGLWGSVARG